MSDQPRGIFTSEFYVIVIAAIVSVAVGAGYLSQDQATEINSAAVQLINAIVEVVKVLAPIFGAAVYAWSRTKVKTSGK